jgi:hypothetical protein
MELVKPSPFVSLPRGIGCIQGGHAQFFLFSLPSGFFLCEHSLSSNVCHKLSVRDKAKEA